MAYCGFYDDLVSSLLCYLSKLLFLPSFLPLCLCMMLFPIFHPTSSPHNFSTCRASSSAWVAKTLLKHHIPKQAHPGHPHPHPHHCIWVRGPSSAPGISPILAFISLYCNSLFICVCPPLVSKFCDSRRPWLPFSLR